MVNTTRKTFEKALTWHFEVRNYDMHASNINVSRALIKIHLYYMSAPDFCESVRTPHRLLVSMEINV